jgi:hypothetical protein
MRNEIAIPHRDNPEHVENLASIPLMEAQGFVGSDNDLATSLFEYGLAWREIDNGQILFVHNHPTMAKRFDRCTFPVDLDVSKEFDWADLAALMEFVGMEFAHWNALPLPHKIADLVSYHDEENVFGSSYWEGFSISEE